MRKMTKGNQNINVTEFFMLKNMWEYYVTDDQYSDDIKCCLVHGFELELGDVSMAEVSPYIITRTKDLKSLMPAPGWKWSDSGKA